MMPTHAELRVPWPKKIGYAVPAFFLAVVGIPIYVYIPKFYTDVVGVNIAVLGYILFSVRIFDALTDPALGYPISGELHQEIRRAIAQRQNGEPVANPLKPSQVLS